MCSLDLYRLWLLISLFKHLYLGLNQTRSVGGEEEEEEEEEETGTAR